MGLTGKVRWTKLPIDQILQQITALEMETLSSLKGPIKDVIERNIGTQYFSLAELKAMHHPYRIGGPGRPGGIPAGVVNLQSGDFYSSIVLRGPLKLGQDQVAITVYSRGEKELGGWLLNGTHGKHPMQGRPWTNHLRTEIFKVAAPAIAALEKRLRLRVKV